MTSTERRISETFDETIFQCPICLSTLILPVTLTCGHSFCQPCIKAKDFKYTKNVCPICRAKIPIKINYFAVNFVLDQYLLIKYGKQKTYEERLMSTKKNFYPKGVKWFQDLKKYLKQMSPWIIIGILIYHLIKVKINAFTFSFQNYKKKALQIADSIKGQNSLDFKFLLFSQFMRILFSNIVIP